MPARTVVFFHAHPDDEAIFTGGSIWLLAEGGWRVVVVIATGGEWGEAAAGFGHADLAGVRRQETLDAARVLGIARVEFLGYRVILCCAHDRADVTGREKALHAIVRRTEDRAHRWRDQDV